MQFLNFKELKLALLYACRIHAEVFIEEISWIKSAFIPCLSCKKGFSIFDWLKFSMPIGDLIA